MDSRYQQLVWYLLTKYQLFYLVLNMNLSHGHVTYADFLNFSKFWNKLKPVLLRRSHTLHRIIGNSWYLYKCYVIVDVIPHGGMKNLIYQSLKKLQHMPWVTSVGKGTLNPFERRNLTFQKNCFICFNENPLKMTKNAFCFFLIAVFVFKILKLLCYFSVL